MVKNKHQFAILMAGGIGSRFWPMSTAAYPKQFHDMLGCGQSLLQKTFGRLNKFIPTENILILTNARYADLVMEQLPQLKPDQLLLEPAMRNTAPCILYGALKIHKRDPLAQIVVAPSDHWVEDETSFAQDVQKCFETSSKKAVFCTLGIQPSFPNTGYGYIEFDNKDNTALKRVVQFREKPDYAAAKEFIARGTFLWNAGIFIWGAQTILDAFAQKQPEMYRLLAAGMSVYNTPKESEFIEREYGKAENVSIDYAILEKVNGIYVLPANFDWSDLGTWGALYDELPKGDKANAVVNARVLDYDGGGNMIMAPKGKIVVLEGLKDYIVVDKEEVLLIFPKDKEQDIKQLREQVGTNFGEDYI